MINAALLLLGLMGKAASLQATQAPAGPPPPAPVTLPVLPATQEALLPNGLKLVVIEQHRQPVLSIILSIPAGRAFDPERKEGVADMLAALMTRGGAGARSGPEVAASIEALGGSLGAAADPDYLTVQADLVSSHAPLGFELLGDAVLRPKLAAADLETFRTQTAASLEASFGEIETLAERVFLLGAYRAHPYARRSSPQTIRKITHEDLLAFRRARVRPAGSTLIVSGDITLAEARRLAMSAFSSWTGLRPAPLPAPAPTTAPTGIILVHAGGVKEATVVVGGTTFGGADSSYYAAAVLNQLLGDPRGGRLPLALSGQHRWASGAGASFLRTKGRGLFQATAATATEVADSALGEIYAQLSRLRTELVPTEELARAKEIVSGAFALRLQTAGQLAGALTQAKQLGLSPNYLATYRKRVLAVTAEQIRAAARRVAPEKGLLTVVVGDGARLYQPLSRLGTVTLLASNGRPLTLEAIQPRQSPLAIRATGVTLRTDSLAVLVEGKTVGLQVTTLSSSGDSLTYVEQTVLGTGMAQTTRLTFDTLGQMRSLDQSGRVRGQETRIQLSYRGGRVSGTANVPTATGPSSIRVDTIVSPSILDENGVQAILPFLPWELNTRWSFEVFASGEGRVRPMTLTAADLTRIAVPAGEFECYRADLEGGSQRVSFYVTTGAPHRVIRIEIANSPIEFVAVNP
jgi:predicted Zn-dependent peptidase